MQMGGHCQGDQRPSAQWQELPAEVVQPAEPSPEKGALLGPGGCNHCDSAPSELQLQLQLSWYKDSQAKKDFFDMESWLR